MRGPCVYTIGHSTRPIDTLIELLRAHRVARLIDVRTYPRSRRNPQFNREALPEPLVAAGISYAHLPALGGRRTPRADSINTAWREDGFRGYADYMQTPEFSAGLDALVAEAARQPTAIMCAEAVPWKCHRSLISDALAARGIEVRHITALDRTEPHRMREFARIEGDRVIYPGQTSLPLGGA